MSEQVRPIRDVAAARKALAFFKVMAITAGGARSTKLALASLPLALVISLVMRARSFSRRAFSAAISISTFSISLNAPTMDTGASAAGTVTHRP